MQGNRTRTFARANFRPNLETLEDRRTPAVLPVSSVLNDFNQISQFQSMLGLVEDNLGLVTGNTSLLGQVRSALTAIGTLSTQAVTDLTDTRNAFDQALNAQLTSLRSSTLSQVQALTAQENSAIANFVNLFNSGNATLRAMFSSASEVQAAAQNFFNDQISNLAQQFFAQQGQIQQEIQFVDNTVNPQIEQATFNGVLAQQLTRLLNPSLTAGTSTTTGGVVGVPSQALTQAAGTYVGVNRVDADSNIDAVSPQGIQLTISANGTATVSVTPGFGGTFQATFGVTAEFDGDHIVVRSVGNSPVDLEAEVRLDAFGQGNEILGDHLTIHNGNQSIKFEGDDPERGFHLNRLLGAGTGTGGTTLTGGAAACVGTYQLTRVPTSSQGFSTTAAEQTQNVRITINADGTGTITVTPFDGTPFSSSFTSTVTDNGNGTCTVRVGGPDTPLEIIMQVQNNRADVYAINVTRGSQFLGFANETSETKVPIIKVS